MSKERDELVAKLDKAVDDRRKAFVARDKAEAETVRAYAACVSANDERRWARRDLAEYDRQQGMTSDDQ